MLPEIGFFDKIGFDILYHLPLKYRPIHIDFFLSGFFASDIYKFNIFDYIVKDSEKNIEEVFMILIQNILDSCDKLICYANEKNHNLFATKTLNYAKKQGLEVVNLYHEPTEYDIYLEPEREKYENHPIYIY